MWSMRAMESTRPSLHAETSPVNNVSCVDGAHEATGTADAVVAPPAIVELAVVALEIDERLARIDLAIEVHVHRRRVRDAA
jgi:hypothetical protein